MATDRSSNDGKEFAGEITVASRIIDYLSSGLYKDPASCLKELINNSYDADATRVDVFVKPDANHIIIEDDGCGMNREEFEKHFSRISESHKRDRSDKTPSGRKKIGKIGIGFIAANEICDVMEIYSTKKGNEELLNVVIDFKELREPVESRRRKGTDYVKADYVGRVTRTDAKSHYTRIFLRSVRGAAKDILAGARPQREGAESISLYGHFPDTIADLLKSSRINTWKDFDTYSETMLKIGLNVPVRYAPKWVPSKYHNVVKEFEQTTEKLNFSVYYDGTELRKPIVFRDLDGRGILKHFKFEGSEVSAHGYFYVQHKTIKPIEIHGLLVRIREAAVGEHDQQFWGFSPSESSLLQRWVSAEIWADDRLEDAMNIDRRTLRDVHPAYVELRGAIHKQLRAVLKEARQEIYEAGSTERKQTIVHEAWDELRHLADDPGLKLPSYVAQSLHDNLKSISPKNRQKMLLKKYNAVEFYEIIIEVAKQVLTPAQLKKFLSILTERLSK